MNEIHVILPAAGQVPGRSRIARSQVYGGIWSGSTSDPVLYNLKEDACRSSLLGNSSFTLTDVGGEWSQEEYFPFGETSFGCFTKKRYRPDSHRECGKERENAPNGLVLESGLYYYGARYCAAWSCRFTHICFFFKGVRECFAFVSIDPLAGEYPFYTPYQYAGNKPVVMVDVDGLAAGKPNELSGNDHIPDGGNEPCPITSEAGPKKAKLNVYVTMCSERINALEEIAKSRTPDDPQYGHEDALITSYKSAKRAEKKTENLNNAKLKADPTSAGDLVYFKVLEVADREDLLNQLEELMCTGKYELGNVINDGHGAWADIQIGGGWTGSILNNPETDILSEKSFTTTADLQYANRFKALRGSKTAIYVLNCEVAGGERPNVSTLFVQSLAQVLDTPIIASMGPTGSSSDLFFKDTIPTNQLDLISEDHYSMDELKTAPTRFWGIGVWRKGLPGGGVVTVHPPIFNCKGEVSFNGSSDFWAAKKKYESIIH